MKPNWKAKIIYKYIGEGDINLVCFRLARFLNENNIFDFKVVQIRQNYVEIVYLAPPKEKDDSIKSP